MLSKETIKKIAALLKQKESDLEAALTDEKEVSLDIAELTVLTADELTARDNNKVEEGKKEGAKDGEKIAVDLYKKELSKKLGKELKGERAGDVAKEISDMINGSDNDKIKEMQDRIDLLTNDKTRLSTEKEQAESKAKQLEADYDIIGDFPAKRLNILNEKEYLQAIKGQLEFKEDGVHRNGQVLRHPQTQAPLSRKEAIETVFSERKWLDEGSVPSDRGGRGGGNSSTTTTVGIKNKTQALEAWKALNPEKNINPMSPEFLTYVGELAGKDTQFDMYS